MIRTSGMPKSTVIATTSNLWLKHFGKILRAFKQTHVTQLEGVDLLLTIDNWLIWVSQAEQIHGFADGLLNISLYSKRETLGLHETWITKIAADSGIRIHYFTITNATRVQCIGWIQITKNIAIFFCVPGTHWFRLTTDFGLEEYHYWW